MIKVRHYKNGHQYIYQHYVSEGYWKFMDTRRMRVILHDIYRLVRTDQQVRIDEVLEKIKDKEKRNEPIPA